MYQKLYLDRKLSALTLYLLNTFLTLTRGQRVRRPFPALEECRREGAILAPLCCLPSVTLGGSDLFVWPAEFGPPFAPAQATNQYHDDVVWTQNNIPLAWLPVGLFVHLQPTCAPKNRSCGFRMGASALLAEAVQGAPAQGHLDKSSADWGLHRLADSVDQKDVDTPDNWIPRHPRILRLTGRHPLNCEPPVDLLMGAGFITPVSLHLVRRCKCLTRRAKNPINVPRAQLSRCCSFVPMPISDARGWTAQRYGGLNCVRGKCDCFLLVAGSRALSFCLCQKTKSFRCTATSDRLAKPPRYSRVSGVLRPSPWRASLEEWPHGFHTLR